MSDQSKRMRLDIAYDGTDFSGWARQPALRTVQGALEDALRTVCRTPVALTVAGRTDAGVHALGQVAHADVPATVDIVQSLAPRLSRLAARNGDVVVRRVSEAPAGFDARFSALWRSYEYRITVGTPDPLTRRTHLHVPDSLDVDVMQRASAMLLGLRDFGAFCKPREGATTIRALREFAWTQSGSTVVATLRADAFCHSMVRSLVGAVLAIAAGRMSLAELDEVRDAAVRSNRFAMVPAHGLVLTEVGYPPDDALAEQAARARARRDPEELRR